jgi:hypothetical protein
MFPGAFANNALLTRKDAASTLFCSSWCIVLIGGDKGLLDLPRNVGLETSRALHARMFPVAFANGTLLTWNDAPSELFCLSWRIVLNDGDKGLLDLPRNVGLAASRALHARIFPVAFVNNALLMRSNAVSALLVASWCVPPLLFCSIVESEIVLNLI